MKFNLVSTPWSKPPVFQTGVLKHEESFMFLSSCKMSLQTCSGSFYRRIRTCNIPPANTMYFTTATVSFGQPSIATRYCSPISSSGCEPFAAKFAVRRASTLSVACCPQITSTCLYRSRPSWR